MEIKPELTPHHVELHTELRGQWAELERHMREMGSGKTIELTGLTYRQLLSFPVAFHKIQRMVGRKFRRTATSDSIIITRST